MTYRGDDEPEYIDDDEYYDPDEYNDSKEPGGRRSRRRSSRSSRRSNVLGGSFRASDDENAAGRPGSRSKSPFAAGGKGPRDPMPKGMSRADSGTRRSTSSSSPGAGANDRRARLAGGDSYEKRESPQPQNQTDKPDGGGRFAGLWLRLAGGRTQKQDSSRAAANDDGDTKPPTRVTAIASGIRSRFGGLRNRGKTREDKARGRRGSPFRSQDAKHPGQSAPGVSRASQSSRPNRATDTRTRPELKSGSRFNRGTGQSAKLPGRTPAAKAPKLESADWLDLDRKLDLAGVGLVFGAIVLFFSALSQEHAAISAVHNFIGQFLGWGAMTVPIAMFAVGMWLIIRHFGDQPPAVDPIRLVGIVLAFVGVLALFQYLDSFGYVAAIPDAMQAQQVECAVRTTGRNACEQEMARLAECRIAVTSGCLQELVQHSYQRSQGGGYVGAWLYLTLVNNFTEIGGFVIVVMVLTFGMMMMTRQSMAEIAVAGVGIGRSLRSRIAQSAAKGRARRLQAEQRHALAKQPSPLRVSKPPPAQLPGSDQPARALPEPAADSKMPIPSIRIDERDILIRRGSPAFASAGPDQESVLLAASQQHSGVFGRLFGRSKSKTAAQPQAQDQGNAVATRAAGSIGFMGRILNRAGGKPAAPIPSPAPPPQFVPRPKQSPSPAPAARPVSQNQPDTAGSEMTAKQPSASPLAAAKDNGNRNDDSSLARPKDIPSHATGKSPGPRLNPTPMIIASQPEPQMERPSHKVQKPVSSGPASPSRPRAHWKLPDYRSLLSSGSAKEFDHEQLLRQAQVIEETLASFGAPGRVVEVNTGPVITQFAVEPDYLTARSGKKSRVKVSAISQLDKDLQLALGAKSIRIEAPVPGKGYVGIEVPNPGAALVSLRDIMESESFRKIKSPLAVALGMAVDGTPISGDLTQMPHLLIAGTTGSGKSVCVNAIINSIVATQSPETVKFIMVDPKRVELTGYNGMPHLIAPVVVELEHIVSVLKWVTREMDERYKKFSSIGARNVIDYNKNRDASLELMPYIVVIIDELADLMMSAPEETERTITRIAALARATGIHLIIATQRPSVDVVTGLIKANFPARIAFAVAGSVDSRVILDQPGAERLLGTGDMLYLSGDSPAPLRLQGVFVSDDEINNISRYWMAHRLGIETVKPISIKTEPPAQTSASPTSASDDSDAEPSGQTSFWDMSLQRDMTGMAVESKTGNPDPQEDELYQTAVDMVRRLDKASISLLQRRLRIGYTRAARLVDMMEERGVVGPPKEGSSKPRDVIPE